MHAILLLSHKGFDYICKFCKQFNNDNRFDIYIHYDTKLKLSNDEINYLLKTFNIQFITSQYEGSYMEMSLIDMEILLMKESMKKNYSYYHIMSEQCYISVPLDKFYSFFDNNNNNYIESYKDSDDWKIINADKNYRYTGSQWMSLTNECVKHILYILDNTNFYEDFSFELKTRNEQHKAKISADESFFQNLLVVYPNNAITQINDSLRYFDFEDPLIDFIHPHTLVYDKKDKYIDDNILNKLIMRKIDYKNLDSIKLLIYIKSLKVV